VADIQSLSLGDLAVCACGARNYNTRDAVHSALFRGEIDARWRTFLQGVEAENRAEERELEIEEDAFDESVEAFRYEHDLITAEETEQWLRARELDLDQLGDYFTRQYWHRAAGEKVEPAGPDFVSAPPDLRELFIAELILSDQLDSLAMQLMWRLATAAASDMEKIDADSIAAERREFFKRSHVSEADLARWLKKLQRDAAWFEETAAMEAAYRRLREMVLDPQSRKKELAMMRMPLTRFEAEVIEVESRDAAKEALFCIREDGMSMEEVAAEGRYPYRSIAFLRKDLPEDMEKKFLSVAVGDILDPVARGDGFELYRILKKVEPQPDDPEVQQQIDERLVARHFSQLTDKYVEARAPSRFSAE
jgi:hypothetical protein